MPPKPPPPFSAHPRESLTDQAARECASAEAILNPGHPLIAILRQSQTVMEQALTVAGLQAAGVILLWKGPLALPLALTCGVVQIALGLRIVISNHRNEQPVAS